MEDVICFGICDSKYIDMVKVALYSFYQHNDLELKLFLTDDSSKIYKETFKNFDFFNKIEFIDFCKGTKTKAYIDKHFDDFKTFSFCFDKSGILNVTIANEVTDYMSERYSKDYRVILRLDLDVIFFNSVLPSIKNFIESSKTLGGCQECASYIDYGRRILKLEKYIQCKKYLNAGNFMYNTAKMYKNQFERMCNLFETIGFEKFHYFDQDTVNIMYSDDEKYDANDDGWIIPIIPIMTYSKIIGKKIKPIFIHFVGTTKPFIDPDKYEKFNISDDKSNCFSIFFPFYLEIARKTNCSKEFIEQVEKNYLRFKDFDVKDGSGTVNTLLKLLAKIIKG